MKMIKTTSVFLAVVLLCAAIFGCFATTASAAGTVTYSYVIKTTEEVNSYEGKIVYPSDSLSVKQVTVYDGTGMTAYNDVNGEIVFNAIGVQTSFDFSDGSTAVTVVFDVNGDYEKSAVYGEMEEFFNTNNIANGNTPFDYSNVFDGEVDSCGHTDIDDPDNSYSNTKYTINYSYLKKIGDSTPLTYTKTAWSNLTSADTIAQINAPDFQNPYCTYSFDSAEFSSTNTISAKLNSEKKMYSVTVNGEAKEPLGYLEQALFSDSSQGTEGFDWYIDGNYICSGISLSVIATGKMTITKEASETGKEQEDNSTLIQNALYVCNDVDNNGEAYVKMEMLASATTTDFERMGVAFALSEKEESQIKNAVDKVTSGTATDPDNKIAVHNSGVNMRNIYSRQYQFIYAPYISVSNPKVTKNTSLYFYSYVVNTSGEITISNAAQVDFANVIA